MHMALTAEEWLNLNAAMCHRLNARITIEVCKLNRVKPVCSGCFGLYNQPEPAARPLKLIKLGGQDAVPEQELSPEHEDDSFTIKDSAGACSGEQNDEDLEEELLSYFPDLVEEEADPEDAEESEEDIDRQFNKTEGRTAEKAKYAVYVGRCQRCRGYMVPDSERQFANRDKDVHRCFTCGWRVSPVYHWNRLNPMAGFTFRRE